MVSQLADGLLEGLVGLVLACFCCGGQTVGT